MRARLDHQGLAAGCPRGESFRDGRQRGIDAEFRLGLVQGQDVQEVQALQGHSGAAYAGGRFDGDCYDCKVYIESLKRGGDAFLVRQVPPACGAA